MNCPKCSTPLEEGAAFCTNCGTPVPTPTPAAERRFCTNCGAMLEPGATVCAVCGTPCEASVAPTPAPAVSPAPAPAPAPMPYPVPEPAQRGGHKGLLIGGIIAAVLLLCVIGGIVAVRLLSGATASVGAQVADSVTEPAAESAPAESTDAQPAESVTAEQPAAAEAAPEPAAAEWVVEPTIEADNIDVMVQGEPNRDYIGMNESGYPDYSYDYNSVLQQYAYPLCAYTKDGKTGIIKYDGTMLVDNNYKFTYVGNHAQLLVGNEFYGDNPSLHDMWLVTAAGASSEPYEGSSSTSATVYYPNGWGVPCWADGFGIGSYGEGGFFPFEEGTDITGAAMLTSDLNTWEKYSYGDGFISYSPAAGTDWAAGIVPLFKSQRIGTDVYEDVTVCVDGLFGVKKNGKWGYIDTTGKYIFPCEYDSSFALPKGETYSSEPYFLMNGEQNAPRAYAYTPSDGYLVLCKGGQYGLFTTAGEEVIPFGEYEALRPVCGGKLWAEQGGKWGVLALTGVPATESTALTAPELPGDPEPEATAAPQPAAAPAVTAAPVQNTASEYVFPHSDTVYLTDADLRGLDATTLRIARNEILARHGRLFDSADLQAHFNACSWYHGTISPSSFSFSVLNTVELANIELIKAYE